MNIHEMTLRELMIERIFTCIDEEELQDIFEVSEDELQDLTDLDFLELYEDVVGVV